ncbi:MAG: deoxynucleoside kinase [Trueperaceae bacterium]|nr:deoxynucleoside kinase [Trueperaceae bacterium]
MYLAIAGNIGVGKSRLTELVARRYGLEPVYEAVDDNPYLADFYQDMSRYAFHSQMFFLAKRLEQHVGSVNGVRNVVQDRTLYEDAAIFARHLFESGMMSRRDFDSYQLMVRAASQALRPPDLLVYLRASVPTLKSRIALRGRDYEADIAPEYLQSLNDLYERWLSGYRLSETLIVEADGLDFVNRSHDRSWLLGWLEQHGLGAQAVS